MRSKKTARTPIFFLLRGIAMVVSQGSSFAQADSTPPDPINSISLLSSSGGAIDAAWSATGDDGSTGALASGHFRIDYSSDPLHAFSNAVYMLDLTTSVAAGSAQSYTLAGLLGNATYSVTVYIGDEVPNYSGLPQIGEVLTKLSQPALTAFSAISTGSFTASFGANNASGTEYYVDIATSSDFAVAVSSGWTASLAIDFSGLQPRTTYYARAKARNSAGAETAYASFGSVLLDQYPGTSAPRPPLAEGSYSGGSFTLSWNAVARDVSGGAINIKKYEIHESSVIGGPLQPVASVSSATFSWSAAVSAARRYSVVAVDEYNNAGAGSAWIKNTNGSAAVVSDDGKAFLDMSKAVSDSLRALSLAPVLSRQPGLETGDTLSAYKLYFRDGSYNDVLYRDFPGEVSLTLPYAAGSSFGGVLVGPRSAYDHAVYLDNGVEEVGVGGIVDPSLGTISLTAGKAGIFRVRPAARPESFRITQTVPRKIFTPNGDGIWDDFNIVYDNPQALEITDAKVFDLSGARVADLRAGGAYGADSLHWDGKGAGGGKALSAVYIYQFRAGEKYYNGTVVLAR